MIAQTCDPALTALFTPLHPQAGRYEVCTTSDPIETVAERGWTIETLDPLEAFGSAGPYDRFALSRLYGGRRAQVARGWYESVGSSRDRHPGSAPDRDDGTFESITLISPYPDASLTRLLPGTMTIRLVISRE